MLRGAYRKTLDILRQVAWFWSSSSTDKVRQAAQKLEKRKKYREAIAEYQKLAEDPDHTGGAWLKISDLYLKMGEHVASVAAFERFVEDLVRTGMCVTALQFYRSMYMAIHPYVPHLDERLGHLVPRIAEIYAQLDREGEAGIFIWDYPRPEWSMPSNFRSSEPAVIDLLCKIIDLDPNNPLPYLNLAEALIRVGNVDSAIERFGTAAEIYLARGRHDEAQHIVKRLAQLGADEVIARITGVTTAV